jgi:hypothetical protein
MPSFNLLKEVAPSSEWHPRSALMVHRNHHSNGQQEMIEQIEVCTRVPAFRMLSLDSLFTVACMESQLVPIRAASSTIQVLSRRPKPVSLTSRKGSRSSNGQFLLLDTVCPGSIHHCTDRALSSRQRAAHPYHGCSLLAIK